MCVCSGDILAEWKMRGLFHCDWLPAEQALLTSDDPVSCLVVYTVLPGQCLSLVLFKRMEEEEETLCP